MRCPICHGEESTMIYRLCDNMKIMGDSFPEKPAYIVSCDKCGLVYVDTVASQKDFLSYYRYNAIAPKYYDMFGETESRKYYEHVLDLISPYISTKSKLLDIAGSWGEMAAYISEAGYRDITVLDVNEKCLKSAEGKGLKFSYCSSSNMAEHLKGKFDMVILNHTLEHVLDVEAAMRNIDEIIEEDGYVFIEVPDAACYESEETAPFNFLTYEHVLHLTMNDISNLALIYGYDIVASGSYYKEVSKYPSIYAVLKKRSQSEDREICFSDEGRKHLTCYVEKSRNEMDKFLQPLRESKEPLVLWGIGASTAILLDSFEGCNVERLIDRNPKRQGLVFNVNGKKLQVEKPEISLEGRTIVILSIPYHASIERQIREMGLKNKIISLD